MVALWPLDLRLLINDSSEGLFRRFLEFRGFLGVCPLPKSEAAYVILFFPHRFL